MTDRFLHGGRIFALARQLNIDVRDLDDFSANINPLVSASQLQDWAADCWEGLCHYPDVDYALLRRVIADYHQINMSAVWPGNGATAMIARIVAALKPRRARLMAPTFGEYEKALSQAGVAIDFVHANAQLDFRLASLFDQLDTVDLLFICNPNNPTGKLFDKVQLLYHLKRLPQHVNCVVDEAFIDFSLTGEANSIVAHLSELSNVIVLRSATKFYGMPGLRLGYVLMYNKALLARLKQIQPIWDVNGVAQAVLINALKDEVFAEDTRRFIDKERRRVQAALTALGLHCHNSAVNYYLIETEQAIDLYARLLERHIIIRCCDNYRGIRRPVYRLAVKDQAANDRLVAALTTIL